MTGDRVPFPWGTGVATGAGSLPYQDPDEAARVVVGELPDFPHLPELPARGPGSDLVGRTAALLADLHVDLQPSGWRLTDRRGRDETRAVQALQADLDAFEIAAYGYQGPLKIQLAGPWTLAAALDRSRGDRVLADHGACRDVAQSLAEGLAEHRADVARRVPGASVVVQLDEPSLPAVLAGTIPTASGFARLRAVPRGEAEALLGEVLAAAADWPVLHCCAPDPPGKLAQDAGAVVLSCDISILSGSVTTELAEAVDGGLVIWPGVVPSVRPVQPPSDRELVDRFRAFAGRLDEDPAQLARGLVVTPACGLAGTDVEWARRAYALAVSTARAVAESVDVDR
ncbi:MAG: methionine synthase [Jiangellaceae bacterium]|nr:methionine synthase [Jiangellaceae bacterium]